MRDDVWGTTKSGVTVMGHVVTETNSRSQVTCKAYDLAGQFIGVTASEERARKTVRRNYRRRYGK